MFTISNLLLKQWMQKKRKKSSIVLVFEKFNGLTIKGLGVFIVNNSNQRVWLVLSLPIF